MGIASLQHSLQLKVPRVVLPVGVSPDRDREPSRSLDRQALHSLEASHFSTPMVTACLALVPYPLERQAQGSLELQNHLTSKATVDVMADTPTIAALMVRVARTAPHHSSRSILPSADGTG